MATLWNTSFKRKTSLWTKPSLPAVLKRLPRNEQRSPTSHVSLLMYKPSEDNLTSRDPLLADPALAVDLGSMMVVAKVAQPTTSHATYVRRLATLEGCAEDDDHNHSHPNNHTILPLCQPLPHQEHALSPPHH